MRIIKSGTKVKTVIGEVKGIIIGVCIRGAGQSHTIEYHMRYFKGGERFDCWLYDFEIEIDKPKTGTGFNRDRSNDDYSDSEPLILLGNE